MQFDSMDNDHVLLHTSNRKTSYMIRKFVFKLNSTKRNSKLLWQDSRQISLFLQIPSLPKPSQKYMNQLMMTESNQKFPRSFPKGSIHLPLDRIIKNTNPLHGGTISSEIVKTHKNVLDIYKRSPMYNKYIEYKKVNCL